MSAIGKKRKYEEQEEANRTKRRFKNHKIFQKYSARDKSRWPELIQARDTRLMTRQIAYLLKPSEIAEIKADPPLPAYRIFRVTQAKPTEEPHEKEIRDMHNDVVKKLYTDSLSRKISKREQLQKDYEEYLSILLDELVDAPIQVELHDYMKRECEAMNPEERFHA
eukprot:gene59532-79434_t